MNKKIVILIILIILLGGGFIFYKQKLGNWPWQNKTQETVKEDKNAPTGNAIIDWGIKKNEGLNREAVMEDFVKNISLVVPEKGAWQVKRFWFVFGSEKDFYVEYGAGAIIRKMLISVENGQYKVVGYFVPGEDDWEIKTGDDLQYGKPLELYEFDNNLNKWIRRS